MDQSHHHGLLSLDQAVQSTDTSETLMSCACPVDARKYTVRARFHSACKLWEKWYSVSSWAYSSNCLRSWGGTQELDRMDWSGVNLISLTVGDLTAAEGLSADEWTSIDVAQMLLAPRLQSFSLYCNRIQLHRFSGISRKTLEASRFNLTLICRELFAQDESAWLESLGLELARKIDVDGERTNPYWEYSTSQVLAPC